MKILKGNFLRVQTFNLSLDAPVSLDEILVFKNVLWMKIETKSDIMGMFYRL